MSISVITVNGGDLPPSAVHRRGVAKRVPGLGAIERSMATAYGVIGGILLFGALGGVIDERFRTKPWATLIGFLAGVTIVLYGLGLSMRERLADRHGRITRSVKR